jgi:hypothetical protein
MGLDPVRQFLRPGRLGVSVIGGAKDGDKDLRFTHDPGCAIDDHDFLAGVIDKYLVAGRMVLPHGRRQAPLELPEQIAEATVAIASRVNHAILFPEHHQIDAGPLEFAGERALIWLGAPAEPALDAGMGKQTLFKNGVREVASQRPRKPGRRGPLEIVLDRAARHAEANKALRTVRAGRGSGMVVANRDRATVGGTYVVAISPF